MTRHFPPVPLVHCLRFAGDSFDPGGGGPARKSHWVLWLFLGLLGLAVLVGVGIHRIQSLLVWRGPPAVLLVYEVDPDSVSPDEQVNMSMVVAMLERRVGVGPDPLAEVKQVGERRVQVGVYQSDAITVRRVEAILESLGTLEFRILCNDRDHADIIQQAEASGEATVVDAAGKRLARWVPIQPGEEQGFVSSRWDNSDAGEGPGAIHWRTVTDAQGNRSFELLAFQDDYDVTGAYLRSVSGSIDRRGKPCVEFSLDRKGARLFGRLTGENLPDEKTDFTRRLAIILNGYVFSAPNLQSTITDQAEITGNFTRQEVEDLVRILNAGALPVRLKQVSKKLANEP